MCGILGIVSKNNLINEVKTFSDALDLLSHRGPANKKGMFFTRTQDHRNGIIDTKEIDSPFSVYLGHTRLPIIDLSEKGNQPMTNGDESIWVIYNGEISNFLSLKDDLKNKYRFKSSTDTEVILHAYAEYGDSFLKKLRGMFSLLILDTARKRMLIARDPMGIKPLYSFRDEEKIIISSEIKPILRVCDKRFRLNSQALYDYLSIGYTPGPSTFFEGIKKIYPGEFVTLGISGETPNIEYGKFYNLNAKKTYPSISLNDAVDELDSKLYLSVKNSLHSDVPVGILLSGGLDSSTITRYVSQISKEPVKSFSIGFRDKYYDESEYSDKISQICGTDHRHFYVDNHFTELLPGIVATIEEPIADPAAIPQWVLLREASKEVKVILTGEGGDEAFAGYSRYFWDRLASLYDHLPKSLKNFLASESAKINDTGEMTIRNIPRRVKKFFLSGKHTGVNRYLNWFRIFGKKETLNLIKNDRETYLDTSFLSNLFSYLNKSSQSDDRLSNRQTIDIRTMLLDNLLLKTDKISMAHSLEARVPFLDTEIIDFTLNLPASYKMNLFKSKLIERKLMLKKMPEHRFPLRKHGFEVPIGKWLLESGWEETKQKILLLSSQFCILNPDALQEVIENHEKRNFDAGNMIFSLLVLSVWFDKYSNYIKTE